MARRYRRLKFSILAILLLVLLAEAALRLVFVWQGYAVGSLAPNWFPKVLEGRVPQLQPSFFTDVTGMFRTRQGFWQDGKHRINDDGFLGGPLVGDTTKRRVLLIGDSFVWGAGATEPDSSFAAMLAKDTTIRFYNTGIPGADPAQYQLVAERYIPALQPDVTMVFVYLGNDVVDAVRKPRPYGNLYYPTDMGWFPGYYKGRYFSSLEESYRFYLGKYTPSTYWQKLVCHTATGTALYALPLRLEERRQREQLLSSSATNQHLKHIAALCSQYGSKLVILPIPFIGTDFSNGGTVKPEQVVGRYQNVFSGFDGAVFMPLFSTDMFHPLPDGHFNNRGHLLMLDGCRNELGNIWKTSH